MSATGRGSARHPDDFYRTPSWVVSSILPLLSAFRTALDPCAGDGAILDILRPRIGEGAFGLEIDQARADVSGSTCADSLSVTTSWAPRPDLIITNPPYSMAMEFVTRAFRETDGEVAMLLRLSWLCSNQRRAFHQSHPSDIFPLPRRPEFAASIKCAVKSCGWKVMQPIDAPRFQKCPSCGGKVTTCTSDASEYAWFVWGPGRGNRWHLLGESA